MAEVWQGPWIQPVILQYIYMIKSDQVICIWARVNAKVMRPFLTVQMPNGVAG